MNTPYMRAVYALAYILLIVLLLNSQVLAGVESSFLGGVTFLSLFVFSAAVMGYIFLSQPLLLYLDGKKKDALAYFFQTLVSFGVLTGLLLIGSLMV